MVNPAFWQGKSVLLTGHTGFKGSWAAAWLAAMGARVTGVALAPETEPNLYGLAKIASDVTSIIADIRDAGRLGEIVGDAKPDVIIHMAAQALVRRSYDDPLETFSSNVMGTANLLEAARKEVSLKAVLIVTTDKVYHNAELNRPFKEEDRLGGHDPYSASKAAAEIVTASYGASWFSDESVPAATARGGNVIGGGDFSADRIVPDIWRAAEASQALVLRYPDATRPWQHVLDCLNGYFCYIEKLVETESVPRALNFGPTGSAAFTVAELTEAVQEALDAPVGWERDPGDVPREMQALSLDTTKARETLEWQDRLPGKDALTWTADWYLAHRTGADVAAFTRQQIAEFMDLT